MPEGPECHIIVDQLNKELSEKKITDIKIIGGRYLKQTLTGLDSFKKLLPITVKSVNVKGKFIWFEFENITWTLWNTLGMSGGWRHNKQKHSHVALKYQVSDEDTKTLWYTDVRRFGTLKFVENRSKLDSKLRAIGPDMLTNPPEAIDFVNLVKKYSHYTTAQILMSQNIISGVGNYLKSQILYMSRLSPHRTIKSMTDLELVKLLKAIKIAIKESYEVGAPTIRNYTDLSGKSGNYVLYVYKKKLDPHGNKVISEQTKDKRVTYWVPDLQK